jgi:hypothetical protein
MQSALNRAANPIEVEYILAANSDDSTRPQLGPISQRGKIGLTKVVSAPFKGSAPAWSVAAEVCSSLILIQMQDDLELPQDWDRLLLEQLETYVGKDWQKEPVVIAVGDGYRKDGLLCTAICSRVRYEQQGFLCADYLSVFSDDEFTYRALRDARDGKCQFVDARHIVFKHEHAYHNKDIPMDATYQRENSAEAYTIGQAIFAARNPQAATDGIKTW